MAGGPKALVALFTVLLCALAVATPAQADPPAAQIDFGGLVRTFQLHVPPGKPSGLVVNLHGAGATGRDQAAWTHYDAVADAHGFVVVYPDGVGLSWADGRGASLPDRQGVDDVGFIAALVNRLVSEFGIPPGRVFATGLSAGGFMANRLACERADLFAAVAPVAGTLGANVACNPARPVSVLATHGTADPVVPFGGGPMTGRGGASNILAAQALVDRWRQINGCPDSSSPVAPSGSWAGTERVTYPQCAAGTEVVLTRVNGGGHNWPGDASTASAQFFAAHGR
ncbi:extracellular catalytic domain type 1 short-chain-length polyhydroxyalkanoate depolymerase [Mycolicibacterium sp. XJ870]